MIYLLQTKEVWLHFNSYVVRLGLNNNMFIVGFRAYYYEKVQSTKKLAKILLSGYTYEKGFTSNK